MSYIDDRDLPSIYFREQWERVAVDAGEAHSSRPLFTPTAAAEPIRFEGIDPELVLLGDLVRLTPTRVVVEVRRPSVECPLVAALAVGVPALPLALAA